MYQGPKCCCQIPNLLLLLELAYPCRERGVPELQQRVMARKSAATNRQPYSDPGDSLETLLVLMTRLYTFSPSLCLEVELRWAAALKWTHGEHHVCAAGEQETTDV